MLAVALAHHRGALRASLIADCNGLRLADAVTWPAREFADIVAWLPPGSALWRDMGGPAALSEEVRMLRAVEFGLRVLDWRMRQGKGQRPRPLPDPPYAHERRAAEAKQRRKAESFLKRSQGRI
ncbi:hypothetical protein [Microbacterium sp. NPDC091676]|uniref:hypothetical protein n=1 Tax=Microbacterium sp. NPDC091676 TaxID=3364212 RepID=UPI0037FB25AC